MEEPVSDPQRVAELQAQVAALQLKLHQLHATDVNTLRRGYASVALHVEALKHEAARLEVLVAELEPELYPPEYIAEEIGKAAVVGGGVYVLFKVVKTITPMPAKLSRWLRSGLAAVTAIVVTWRFARSSISRFAASLLDHKRRRRAVLREMAELRQRVDILHALTCTMPGVRQQQQQQLAAQQAGAGAGAASGSAFGAAAGEEAHVMHHQQQQQQRAEQFVVVDLPRVESGGFALQSPTVASPAPELAAAQQAAAAFAATSTAAAAAAAVITADSQAEAAAVQQQMAGTAALAAHVAAGAAGSQAVQASSSTAGSALQPQQQQQQQQQQHLPEQQGPSASSSSRSSLEQRQPSRSAFAVPLPSMIMSGWGGVVMQQEQRAQPLVGQGAGAAAAAAAAAAARQGSSDSEGPGEWVEQPGYGDGNDNGASHGGHGGQQVSPVSSSSEEGVLLERE